MSQQRCGIDDEDADEHIVVLWLKKNEGGGNQAHPHKPSVKQSDANFVIVVFADVMYGSDDDHQNDETQSDEVVIGEQGQVEGY